MSTAPSTAPSEAHLYIARAIRFGVLTTTADGAQLIADSEARAVEAATDDQHNKSYSLGYKDGWRDGRLPLNNPLPLALIEQHKAVNDAIWVTCSEHEWSWTHEQQVRMARYIMWAAPIITAERERVRVLETAMGHIINSQPCTHEGGCFYPMHDGNGEYIGEQNVDPLSVIGGILQLAQEALATPANPPAASTDKNETT